MPVYCSYGKWLIEHNKKFYEYLQSMCINPDDLRCNTLISPNAELVGKLSKMTSKVARRDAIKIVQALQIQIDLHDKNFAPGTYRNNIGQGLQISAPSGGVFEIKSGRGFGTTAKVKLASSFEPDLKFKSDEDRNMCIVELVSGEIATDGESFLGNQPSRPVKGSSELSEGSKNPRLEAWKAIEHISKFELRNGGNLDEAQSRLCGLLKFILMEVDSVSEYSSDAKIICTALCYEPLASLYVLLQPYGKGLLGSRFDAEWGFAPHVSSDPHGLYREFCDKFPCTIDMDQRTTLIAELKSHPGLAKVDELQEAYEGQCEKLFSGINYPCGQKLWADEVCFFICNRMKAIRASKSCDDLCKLFEVLESVYPGQDHKAESKMGSEEYWQGLEMQNEIKEVSQFIASNCCLQCCLGDDCKDCVRSLSPSKYLKNLIKLNM